MARKAVCRLAAKNDIELVEKDLSIDDVLGADEMFLTNVIMQVLPITKVEKHDVGDGKVGKTTKKMMEYLGEFIEKSVESPPAVGEF